MKRQYYERREQATARAAELAKEHDSVYNYLITFEPSNGWIARFYSYHNVPAIVEEGHELFTPQGAQHDKDLHKKQAIAIAPRVTTPRTPRPEGTPAPEGVPTAPTSGKTALVWAIADEVTGDGPIDRNKIIDACIAKGINKSTAGTQYSKWKKARTA